MKKILIGFAFVFVVLVGFLFYPKHEENTENIMEENVIAEENVVTEGNVVAEGNIRALFSWHSEVISDEADELIEFMNNNDFNTLYQEFDLSDAESIRKFGNKSDVALFHLCGDPNWNAERIKEEIMAVYQLNQDMATNIRGLVIDVEPYLRDDYKDNKEKVISEYIDNMIEANKYATELGLEYFACVPYWYDADCVDRLTKDGLDGMVVMNYYKGKEFEHLEDEMESCSRYNKELVTAFEMQEVGKHGLTEKNTYHEEGLQAVNEVYEEMNEKNNRIGLAVHYYDAIRN